MNPMQTTRQVMSVHTWALQADVLLLINKTPLPVREEESLCLCRLAAILTRNIFLFTYNLTK